MGQMKVVCFDVWERDTLEGLDNIQRKINEKLAGLPNVFNVAFQYESAHYQTIRAIVTVALKED